jgi:RHS repeat-associated protein
MLPAAQERIPPLTTGEDIFSLAAGVAPAALDTHQGTRTAQEKNPHQGIFSSNRRIGSGATWPKLPGTHQDSGRSWPTTVLGIALDANGNTLSDPSGKQYSWDFENRLTQAVVPGTNGGTTTFRYDPFGRRIQKSGPLGTTNYLYDGDNLLGELDQAGNFSARYAQTERLDEQLAMSRATPVEFYLSDALWSVTSVMNASGVVAQTYTYDSFGKLSSPTGSLTNPFQFTDREFDTETGLQFSRYRYYDPNIGRFLSEDPIRFEEKNAHLYLYVRNRPTNLIDPLGLWVPTGGECWTCVEAASGAYWMWDGYERMKHRNWKGDDKYYHCMANCLATDSGWGGAMAAKVISFFRTDVSSRIREPDDWRNDDKANKCGQQGGDCNKTCAPWVPKASPGKPPFPGW